MKLICIAFLLVPELALAQLVIDNFKTGKYEKTLKSGSDTNTQSGSMMGAAARPSFWFAQPAHAAHPIHLPNRALLRFVPQPRPLLPP